MPAFLDFTEEELRFTQSFKTGELAVDAGSTVLLEGSTSPHLLTVLSGWALRHKTLPDGRRQVINFVLPGDLIGLQSELLGEMKHSVEASTDMVLCVFSRERVWDLFRAHPSRAYDLTWLAAREEHFLGDNLLTVGRRSALEKIAFGIWSLYDRARAIGLIEKGRLFLPYTQRDFADAFGLSVVHTNKTISRLRKCGILSWKDRWLEVKKEDSLREIAAITEVAVGPRPLI